MTSTESNRTELTSVIVPAYNEGQVILHTLAELRRVLEESVPAYEIVVVDDGSQDNTAAIVSELAERDPHVRIESYTPNYGKGYALRRGFKATQGGTIVFFDADMDISPECISVLLERLREGGYDGVVGSKMHHESVVAYPSTRRLFSRAVHLFVWALLQIPVKDTQVGMKVFRRPVLKTIMDLPTIDGFAFDIELLALAQRAGFHIVEGPVRIEYSRFSSTVNLASVARAFLDTLGVFYRVRIKGVDLTNGNR